MQFGTIVCASLNMDHRELRRELSQELRNKINAKHVKGKDIKIIFKQVDVVVTAVSHTVCCLCPQDCRQCPCMATGECLEIIGELRRQSESVLHCTIW